MEPARGSELLDDAALKRSKQWRFVTAVTLGGEGAAGERIPIVFRWEIDEPDASDEVVENAEEPAIRYAACGGGPIPIQRP